MLVQQGRPISWGGHFIAYCCAPGRCVRMHTKPHGVKKQTDGRVYLPSPEQCDDFVWSYQRAHARTRGERQWMEAEGGVECCL